MDYLAKPLRRSLESTVVEARDVAELAATAVLKHLGVGEPKAPGHLSPDQQALRRRLRAHGRQLGDHRKPDGKQSIAHLVQETAYEHWHRMLFARFLAENHLLMHPDGVALTLDECEELAPDEGATNGWELAGRYASRMLPQIFRTDSPVLALPLAPEHQRKLERLLAGLDAETFHATDSLGWVYQFWQSKKKDEVNRSEVKIGADELPAVTQLFTEPYMVHFLLDNSLGAWWAGRTLSDDDLRNATSEDELRNKASIPGVPLDYLRFVKQDDGTWTTAAGTFDAWPDKLCDLKTLDPSCGSGHFLVAAFLMFVQMRIATERMSAQDAVDAVLRENIHGLELDQRCVELAAFALALTAWKLPEAGGYRTLPEMHIACSGLSIRAKREEWLSLAGDDNNLHSVLSGLYHQFHNASSLGSLINPEFALGKDSLFESTLEEIEPLLVKALSTEKNDDVREIGVVAQGMAKAAHILSGRYALVITNVPYLTQKKQSSVLYDFCDKYYPHSKYDLSTVFLERCLGFCEENGTSSIVLPQNWLFLSSYKKLRESLLQSKRWDYVVRLGAGAFETISGEVVKGALVQLTNCISSKLNVMHAIDVANKKTTSDKSDFLSSGTVIGLSQSSQIKNPDHRIIFEDISGIELLLARAISMRGIVSGDNEKWGKKYWELPSRGKRWKFLQSTPQEKSYFSGRENIIDWISSGKGMLRPGTTNEAYGRKGVALKQVGDLSPTLYEGNLYDNNTGTLVANDEVNSVAIWCYCSSEDYHQEVRKIDQKLNVTNATLIKVPFDIKRWTQIARERYPNGLPNAFTDDSTQWVFHGHPCGSVIWDETVKRTNYGPLRMDDTVLQVTVARLLGYRWPGELDADMELADEQREWINLCNELAAHVDDDGIVCIPTIRGEKPAAERLLSMLQAAYGDEWAAQTLSQLLAESGARGKSLEWWLREKFFEQHCKLFQHRPFIWHIWDGLKDGFGALVNYHQLDRKTLETLIYTYLGDWIGLQERAVNDGIDGAQIRLTAAQDLKRRLELILEGEQPYDIFVRWKPLEQQPIGWEPDLNDGVRLNIRPFATAEVLRHNKKPKLNIHWNKDRGKDVESAPWYQLGLEYDGKEGDRINDHHLNLTEKKAAQNGVGV